MPDLTKIKRVHEAIGAPEANMYLKEGWTLLDSYPGRIGHIYVLYREDDEE